MMTFDSLPEVNRSDLMEPVLEAIAAAADPSEATRAFCADVFPSAASVRVLAIGKAGATMMRAGLGVIGGRVSAGLVVAPERGCASHGFDARIEVMPSDHPLPTERSVAAGDAVLRFVSEGHEPLVVLLSGGGSAMVVWPVPGVSLDDLRDVADQLMRAGATITELNGVRKHIDQAKGGRVGQAAGGRPVAVGVMSDVLGDRLDVISSGPFVGDASTFESVRDTLDRYGVRVESIDRHVANGLERKVPETPLPSDASLASITHEVIASSDVVAGAAANALESRHVSADVHRAVAGDAASWGAMVAERLRQGPGGIVIAGESVVGGVKKGSVGGPVQEAVLAAGHALRQMPGWLVFGIATDGIDGPTDAAGAALTPDSLPEAGACERALADHASHGVLDAAGALIRTGPAGTNLNDVLVGVRWAE